MSHFTLFCFSLFVGSWNVSLATAAPQPLFQGRWVGSVQLNGSDAKLGLVFDIFLAQPNDTRAFPRLESLVRLSLGGPLGIERKTIHYTSVQYNYETGELTLDEEGAPFVFQAGVKSKTLVEGQFTDKVSGRSGPFSLVLGDALPSSGEPCEPGEPCDPPDDPNSRLPISGFLPTLAGQYHGSCRNGGEARLEIGGTRNTESKVDSFPSAITWNARLGLKDIGQCHESKQFCVVKAWESIDFLFMNRRIILQSNNSADHCDYGSRGELECTVHMGSIETKCSFVQVAVEPSVFKAVRKSFQLAPRPDDMVDLPTQGSNLSVLQSKVNGEFGGYVFNESKKNYYPLQFFSIASTSTDNPHNEPNVFVSGTLQFSAKDSPSGLRFPIERRSFFLGPGFALRSESSDIFLVVSKWTQGFIRGTAYSESSGRIGPFELLKNLKPEDLSLPNGSKSAAGSYVSGNEQSGWRVDAQVSSLLDKNLSVERLTGTAQILTPGLPFPRFSFDSGYFENFENFVSFEVLEPAGGKRAFSGIMLDNGDLNLRLGSSGSWGVKMAPSYSTLFKKIQ